MFSLCLSHRREMMRFRVHRARPPFSGAPGISPPHRFSPPMFFADRERGGFSPRSCVGELLERRPPPRGASYPLSRPIAFRIFVFFRSTLHSLAHSIYPHRSKPSFFIIALNLAPFFRSVTSLDEELSGSFAFSSGKSPTYPFSEITV